MWQEQRGLLRLSLVTFDPTGQGQHTPFILTPAETIYIQFTQRSSGLAEEESFQDLENEEILTIINDQSLNEFWGRNPR